MHHHKRKAALETIKSVTIVAAPHYGGKGSVADARSHGVIDYSQHVINPHIRKHLHGLVRTGDPQFSDYKDFHFPEDWMQDAKIKAFFRSHIMEYVAKMRADNPMHYGHAMIDTIAEAFHIDSVLHPVVTGPLYPGDIPPLIEAFGDGRLSLVLIEVSEENLAARHAAANVTPEGSIKIARENQILFEETLPPLLNHLHESKVKRLSNNNDRESFVEKLRQVLTIQ